MEMASRAAAPRPSTLGCPPDSPGPASTPGVPSAFIFKDPSLSPVRLSLWPQLPNS